MSARICSWWKVLFGAAIAALAFGCSGSDPAAEDASYSRTQFLGGVGFEGVDLLLVVDNSVSMAEEQAILATSIFPLVNALANPIDTDFLETDWPYEAAEELRVAVVTSDMGLSYSGVAYNEGWPGAELPPGCDPATGLGDNGEFQHITADAVTLMSGVIPCDDSGAQCPEGWSCTGMEDDDATPGQGVCTGDAAPIDCPAIAGDWAETTDDEPSAQLHLQAACLADRGVSGCEFEQPLQSAACALARGDQVDFLDAMHLLAIVVVSDEDDCSMQYGPEVDVPDDLADSVDPGGLFTEDEVQILEDQKVGLACGNHPDYLFTTQHFYEAYVGAKRPQAVVFAAIVGVPYEGDQADECQGTGSEIDDCNELDDMQLVAEQPGATQDPPDYTWSFRPACTRNAGEEEVTRASPGRRYVELARDFGAMGSVFSICNPDWSPAIAEVAMLVGGMCPPTCFGAQLAWDPEEKVAVCDLVVEYVNDGEECPAVFGGAEPVVEHETSEEGEDLVMMYCPIPKIPLELDCGFQDLDEEAFGWSYCENLGTEDFDEACSDGLDNDADGATDCDDDGCPGCQMCGGTGAGCPPKCTYDVRTTDAVKSRVAGHNLFVQCPL